MAAVRVKFSVLLNLKKRAFEQVIFKDFLSDILQKYVRH